MRSTAFTSLALGLAWAGAAVAEAPAPGCYARDYDAAHLASQPEQVVARMRLSLGEADAAGGSQARLSVVLSGQGRAKAEGLGGTSFAQDLVCGEWDGAFQCGVECDGGILVVERVDAEGLTFSTDHLWVGELEGCGEDGFDIVERLGEPVSYRLLRVETGACG